MNGPFFRDGGVRHWVGVNVARWRHYLSTSLLLAVLEGCGQGENCLKQCSWRLTLDLAQPVTGSDITVTLRPGGSRQPASLEIHCRRQESIDGGVADADSGTSAGQPFQCTSNARGTDYHISFGQDGFLQQIVWTNPPANTMLHVTIIVDGMTALDRSIDHRPKSTDVCGSSCYAPSTETL